MAELDCTIEESMMLLSKMYHKILKINLTTDTYKEVKVYEEELKSELGYSSKLSQWLQGFADAGLVYGLDVPIYLEFTDINNLRRKINGSNGFLSLRYRRKTKGEFRWVIMLFIPAPEYTEDNQVVMFYVRDINDSYVNELEEMRELEFANNYDILTGVKSLRAYNNFCTKINEKCGEKSIGAVFADLNGLKIINDNLGHDAGNEYIRSFAEKLIGYFGDDCCYRVSGDEFIVLFSKLDRAAVEIKFNLFYEDIHKMEIPHASIGFAWSDTAECVEDVIKKAEANMYNDKHEFYKRHPDYRRAIEKVARKMETAEIVKCLSAAYKNIYMINLENDTYHMVKHELDKEEKLIEKTDTYSQFNLLLGERYIDEKFRRFREKIGSIEHLRTALEKEESISCDFLSNRGQWRRTTFHCYERCDGKPTKAVLYTQVIDSERAVRLSQRMDITGEYGM